MPLSCWLSFAALDEEQMLIAASERGPSCSEDEDDADLPASAVFAHAESDSELTAMLARAAARLDSERSRLGTAQHGKRLDPAPCLSSQRCMKNFGSMEANYCLVWRVVCLFKKFFSLSLPLMVEQAGDSWGFPRLSGQLWCMPAKCCHLVGSPTTPVQSR